MPAWGSSQGWAAPEAAAEPWPGARLPSGIMEFSLMLVCKPGRDLSRKSLARRVGDWSGKTARRGLAPPGWSMRCRYGRDAVFSRGQATAAGLAPGWNRRTTQVFTIWARHM